MNDDDLAAFRTQLELNVPRYGSLLACHGADPHNWNIIHELLFAYLLDRAGLPLEYERQLAADNPKTVDFTSSDGASSTAFELVRINFTPTLMKRMSTVVRGFFGAAITSNNSNPEVDSAGQLIRLQEKLCEKADKFPLRRDDLIAVIVADCTEVQLGMFDEDDASTAMLGHPVHPEYQEAFNGKLVQGLYDPEHHHAHSDRFRDRIDAVLFIRDIRDDYRPVLVFRPGTPEPKRARLIEQLSQVPEYAGLIVL